MALAKTIKLVDGIINALNLDDTAKKITRINMHAALSWSGTEPELNIENIEDLVSVLDEMLNYACPDNAARIFAAVHLKSFLLYAAESCNGCTEFAPKKPKNRSRRRAV